MEHLALEVFDLPTKENPNPTASQYAVLEPDATITITDTSEIFADGDVWSYDFTLNVQANAHLFGTAGDIHGSRLHEQINKRRARLWVEGVPLHLGYLKLGDEAEVDAKGNVDITFESGQKTFEELIEGAKANQVPMMSDVRFGLALWTKRWSHVRLKLEASVKFKNGRASDAGVLEHTVIIGDDDKELTVFDVDGEDDMNSAQQYPRMVFPKGRFDNLKTGVDNEPINELNTDSPYTEDEDGTPTYPYCNIALCYQKYDYKKTDKDGNETTNYAEEPEAQREYEYMPANRVNSAPNFFVIYWLRCLMKHLGIYVEENQMMDVEDLRRLFFVNTKCDYKEPKYIRNPAYDWKYGKYRPTVGTSLIPEYFGNHNGNTFDGLPKLVKTDDCGFSCKGFTAGPWLERVTETIFDISHTYDIDVTSLVPEIESIDVKVVQVAPMTDSIRNYYDGFKDPQLARNRYLFDAIATSDCFPNVDISEVINAIESGFGVRLLFSNDYKRVRIVLLRNVFTNEDVQDITCEIVDNDVKVENNIRGFRMTYGNTEDTHFYYKGFADMLPHKKELWVDESDKHDYSHWSLNANYANIINKISAFDKTCYVTPNNGNAYGIKDKDAKRIYDLHQSLFEFAGYMDAEDGDCTGEEETIKTINVNFAPAIMNDLNMEAERNGKYDQRFALFVDEEMRVRRPDLEDLPNEEKQPGVKSYDDADAVYDVEKLYQKYGSGSESPRTHGDGIVSPGEFAITSDLSASQSGLKAKVRYLYKITNEGWMDWVYHYATCEISDIAITGHANEGYRLYLQDNYEPNDDGISPIETHDWGLTLGIMRGSGSDAYVNEYDDPDDDENNAWEIVPGSSATAHPDTCDSYGNEWDYNGSEYITSQTAQSKLYELFPHSNAYFYVAGRGYVIDASRRDVTDGNGVKHSVLFAYKYSEEQEQAYPSWYREYAKWLTKKLREEGAGIERAYSLDLGGNGTLSNVVIEVDTTPERASTMLDLCRLAYASDAEPIRIDNGVGSRYGRFSLKLRAEKPNPYFDPKQPESDSNRRYLQITNKNLQQRGLCDQFYKEYSYWIRNASIVKRTVRMTLAQLLTIDKTKRVRVGDVTGFIRKMQYSVSNETGLGNVVMEIMYI